MARHPTRVGRRAGRFPTKRRLLWRLHNTRDSALAHRWLDGLKGVEIGGAAHNAFHLDTLNVDRTRDMDTVYKREELECAGVAMAVDVVAEGDDLPFPDEAFDFVLASHVLEHLPDPIRALQEWRRVARRYVFVVLPHRARTFDRDRPVTPVDELLRRHEQGLRSDDDRHWTVWTCESFLELCERLGVEVLEHQDPDDKQGNGFAVVLDAS
ncbi:MAG: methyltransferase domain-containing protein [Solirubrobacteraceae bacterium]